MKETTCQSHLGLLVKKMCPRDRGPASFRIKGTLAADYYEEEAREGIAHPRMAVQAQLA